MKKNRLTWGILLLAFGTLMLLDNLNVFSFLGVSIWNILWPVCLIAAGIWIVWASRSSQQPGEKQELSVPVDIVEKYRVDIKYGAGELSIGSHSDAEPLLYCDSEGGLKHEIKQDVDQKHIKLWSPAPLGPFRFTFRRKWHISLNDAIPCELKLNTGACDTRVDLTNTQVTSLKVETGASATQITLPADAGYTRVHASGGAASLTLNVPDSVASQIEVQGGIYSADVNQHRFPRQGKYYRSPGYDTAENKIDIKLEMGVGSIEVR
ncbi:MAG: DUF5668 domain-containing protein [Anaerolineae bacterium]|nr:DUF5668 domain-containing protein [Anaerolineae bacterium]